MLTVRPYASAIAGWLRRLISNQQGVAAIEFALIAPLMAGLYFGTAEFSNALTADRKLTHTASALADLVAQDNEVTDSEMTDILSASSAIMVPFDTGSLEMVVTSVTADSSNKTEVAWSDARNATARAQGSEVDLPAGLTEPGSSVIMTEVSYTYVSPFTRHITGGITLTDRFYLRPRRVNAVARIN